MTSIEEHDKAANQFIEDIQEKIRLGLVKERQKIIAFCASEASTNLFASFLHKKKLIEEGFNVNHRFFSSEKTAERIFSFVFRYFPCLSFACDAAPGAGAHSCPRHKPRPARGAADRH